MGRIRVGSWVMLVACAADNDDGCWSTRDCPPPCLTPRISVEVEPAEVPGFITTDSPFARPYADVPVLPGAGVYTFEFEFAERRRGCRWSAGELDCDSWVSAAGLTLTLDRGPHAVGFHAAYTDAHGVATELYNEQLEPEYALGEGDICGRCPAATVVVELPVEGIAEAEGYRADECRATIRIFEGPETFNDSRDFLWVAPADGTYRFRTACEPDDCPLPPGVLLIDPDDCRILSDRAPEVGYVATGGDELTVRLFVSERRDYALYVEDV